MRRVFAAVALVIVNMSASFSFTQSPPKPLWVYVYGQYSCRNNVARNRYATFIYTFTNVFPICTSDGQKPVKFAYDQRLSSDQAARAYCLGEMNFEGFSEGSMNLDQARVENDRTRRISQYIQSKIVIRNFQVPHPDTKACR
jgi:hypothetical protein